jgi:penicillin V acylase-like amidase (Ntn superfamily)
MRRLVPGVFVLVSVALLAGPARPRSRFLWNDNKLGVFVARSMDWPESTEPILTVFPRGLVRDGGKPPVPQ